MSLLICSINFKAVQIKQVIGLYKLYFANLQSTELRNRYTKKRLLNEKNTLYVESNTFSINDI